jgi:hypothetical protein
MLGGCGGKLLGAPIPGQELVEAPGRMIWQAGERIGEPSLRVDVVELCGRDQCVEGGGAATAFVGAGEGPVFAPDGHHPFILPMSGRRWKSITAGIPILATRSSSGA